MQDQPQPACESRIILTVKDVDKLRSWQPLKEVEKNLKPLNKVIFERVVSLLATERLKWQEEARREIAERRKQHDDAVSESKDIDDISAANSKFYECCAILQLPSLTPPPQEETK